jgi:hypothetical protein
MDYPDVDAYYYYYSKSSLLDEFLIRGVKRSPEEHAAQGDTVGQNTISRAFLRSGFRSSDKRLLRPWTNLLIIKGGPENRVARGGVGARGYLRHCS